MKLHNAISLFHLLILPLVIYLIAQDTAFFTLLAGSLLLFSIVMDITSSLARGERKVISFLHPFSDKIVVLTLLLVFVLQGRFSAFIFGIFLLRDIIVMYVRIIASRDDAVIRGESYGKSITVLQFLLVFMILGKTVFLALEKSLQLLILLLTLTALALGVISIAHYSYIYLKRLYTRKKSGKIVEKEPIVVFANKKSGGYRDKYRRHLLRVFARRRNAPIYYLSGKNIFRNVGSKIKGVDNVVIAGGDGTFEAALNSKSLQEKNLGFFPLGAGNAFYSYFYKGKRFEYLRSRFKFHEVPLDILELEWEGGKRNTLFLSLGVDGEVVHAITRKEKHSFSDYISAGVKVAFGKPLRYDVVCSIDGKKYHWGNCINIILGKVPYIGFGMRSLLGNMGEDDGFILGMACVNTHSPFFNKALRAWAIFLTQLGLAKAPLIPLKGKEFMVESKEPFPLQAGGEFLGYTKWVKVTVKRKQKVLMI